MMKKILLTLFLILAPSTAFADSQRNPCYYNVNGGCTPVATTAPLPVTNPGAAGSTTWTPASPDQHGLTVVASTALTVPTGSTYAVVCSKGGSANYTTDGATTPTGTVGTALAQGACIGFAGVATLSNLRFIQQSGNTSTLDVNYWITNAYN